MDWKRSRGFDAERVADGVDHPLAVPARVLLGEQHVDVVAVGLATFGASRDRCCVGRCCGGVGVAVGAFAATGAGTRLVA